MTIRASATRVMLTLTKSVVGRIEEDLRGVPLTRSELVEFLLTEYLASADWMRQETTQRAHHLAMTRSKRRRSRKS